MSRLISRTILRQHSISQPFSTMSSVVPRDIQEFLDDYPDNTDDASSSANLLFYSNKRRCRPDNLLVDELHEQWKGDYAKLEYKHGFIQWLFPIPEQGMNYDAQPLQRHEITAMTANADIVNRVISSYKLMLDFYGMRLEDSRTGLLSRSNRRFDERYKNLARECNHTVLDFVSLACHKLGALSTADVLFICLRTTDTMIHP